MSNKGLTPDKLEQIRQLFHQLQAKAQRQAASPEPNTPCKPSKLKGVAGWLSGLISGVVGNELYDLVPERTKSGIKQYFYGSSRDSPPSTASGELVYVVTLNLDDSFAALDLLADSHAAVEVGRYHYPDEEVPFGIQVLCGVNTASMLKLTYGQVKVRRWEQEDIYSPYQPKVLTRAQAEAEKTALSQMVLQLTTGPEKPI